MTSRTSTLSTVGEVGEVTLLLLRLLREDVTLVGLTALHGTARTNAKPLGRALLGFHLGHDFFSR